MTISSRRESYVLGGTGHEHERLIRQARIFNPFTERLFRNAGVARGQRVLDIGSGVGDVAMLVAELVGPMGEVVGVERDANTLTKARSRVAEAQLRNVSFVAMDVSQAVSKANDKPFDVIVGRLILEYLRCSTALAIEVSSPWGHHCHSRLLLGSVTSADSTPSTMDEVYYTYSSDV
jgi:2-polyprenyl-3-methyl-5-hydroxy-6-metoxy-1,4-benzoquinol methylase